MTKIIGHRGAMGYRPENTMSSFLKAINVGAHGIEFDVHLTRDNVPVVIHDERVDRTTDKIGEVKDYTFGQIRKLDAGTWFSRDFYNERIPSLKDVLSLDVTEDFVFNIELKAGSYYYPGIERITLEQIQDCHREKQVIISSFDHSALLEVKRLCPAIKTGALFCARLYEPWAYLKSLKCDYYHPDYRTIDSEIIKNANRHNLPVNTYTINNESVMTDLIHADVNMIITNYPDLGIRILNY
ncbi:MAG: glycerophosphodiester phosphodiesterase [Dethiosulfatibacter sp.]|nr:glycerophosphodiester phosphodiesterase [Dethiosulfatibacter sp.]